MAACTQTRPGKLARRMRMPPMGKRATKAREARVPWAVRTFLDWDAERLPKITPLWLKNVAPLAELPLLLLLLEPSLLQESED